MTAPLSLRETIQDRIDLDAVSEAGAECLGAALVAVLDVIADWPQGSPMWDVLLQARLAGGPEVLLSPDLTRYAEGHEAGLSDARLTLRLLIEAAIRDGLGDPYGDAEGGEPS